MVPQKIKKRKTNYSNSISGCMAKRTESRSQGSVYTPCSQQHNSQEPQSGSNLRLMNEWINKCGKYIYNGILFIWREGNFGHVLDETWGHYSMRTKPFIKIQMPRRVKFRDRTQNDECQVMRNSFMGVEV